MEHQSQFILVQFFPGNSNSTTFHSIVSWLDLKPSQLDLELETWFVSAPFQYDHGKSGELVTNKDGFEEEEKADSIRRWRCIQNRSAESIWLRVSPNITFFDQNCPFRQTEQAEVDGTETRDNEDEFVRAGVAIFKQTIMSIGFAKVLCLTDDQVEVAWNGYDQATGEHTSTRIIHMEYTRTYATWWLRAHVHDSTNTCTRTKI